MRRSPGRAPRCGRNRGRVSGRSSQAGPSSSRYGLQQLRRPGTNDASASGHSPDTSRTSSPPRRAAIPAQLRGDELAKPGRARSLQFRRACPGRRRRRRRPLVSTRHNARADAPGCARFRAPRDRPAQRRQPPNPPASAPSTTARRRHPMSATRPVAIGRCGLKRQKTLAEPRLDGTVPKAGKRRERIGIKPQPRFALDRQIRRGRRRGIGS